MDYAAMRRDTETQEKVVEEQRAATRISLLIRPAKIIIAQWEFVCVLRDVSRTGLRVKLFHHLPTDTDTFAIELQNGQSYNVTRIWERGGEAGLAFANEVDVGGVISEPAHFPKRGLRLGLTFPATLTVGQAKHLACVRNLSQQGARLECNTVLAIDQLVSLDGEGLKDIQAKVRWRRDSQFGVVFENTFSLNDFAILLARLQCPGLL